MSEINTLAFVKMFLHLAKYPELSVNGILLSDRPSTSTNDVDSSSYLHFVDCIPLFHGVLSLSPMLEIALSQVEYQSIDHQH
jgi:ER membrane protein complex subunit 8/9